MTPSPWNRPGKDRGYIDIVSAVLIIVLLLIILKVFRLI